jgi:NAD-dependent dihydropyrimidine dehydrogenase PreA subunit
MPSWGWKETARHHRDIGLILASDNAVAVDAVMATLMGLEAGCLVFLQQAADAGLGSWREADIRIEGELTPLKDFKLPPLGGEAIQANTAVQDMLRSKTLLVPRADPDRCTGCGTCVEQCPADALSMTQDLPQVDRMRCVACFCCQEICPEKAMTLQ